MIPKSRHFDIHPFSGLDVAHLVALRAQSRAEHPFLIWEPFEGEAKTWTYARFFEDIQQIAAGFKSLNVNKGDHVLIHLENCPEALLSWFACAHLGAVAVTTNSKSVAREFEYFNSAVEPVCIVTQPKFAMLINECTTATQGRVVTETDSGSQPSKEDIPDGFVSFNNLYGDIRDVALRPADPQLNMSIQFTSGTTSLPKGVVWNHANALWGGKTSSMHENLTPQDIHLVLMPLFHTNALSYSILSTLWTGATAVLQPRYSASRFWDVSIRNNCSWTSLDPFCLRTLRAQPVPDHSYRYWGSPYSDSTLSDYFNVAFISWWGMTETISHGIVSDPFHPCASGAIGRASPVYEVAILNENNAPVKLGETGTLKIKGVPGVSLFKEYLNNPEATAACYDEAGWFDTGDCVTLLKNGDIAFADRNKDILKVGGENVSAFEVERVICSVPGVDECAVVGQPDKLRGERPAAFIITLDNVDDTDKLASKIENRCEQELSEFKRPANLFFVDTLPRSLLGKVMKAKLRNSLTR